MEINLSKSQSKAADKIRRLLGLPNTDKSATLVAILGLSGVGKGTLWQTIKDEFSGVEFVDYHSIYRLKEPQIERKYVTTVVPVETTRLDWNGDIYPVTVKGMTKGEIRDYISQRIPEREHLKNTNIEKIVQQSLGIPLLADRILSRNMSDEEVELLVGTHLSGYWDYKEKKSSTNLMKYLRIMPSQRIVRIFQDSTDYNNIFHDLSEVLKNYEKLQAEGIELNSPFFQTKKSYEIYSGENIGMDGAVAKIFAPNITQEVYSVIRNELLPEGEISEEDRRSISSKISRFSMFNAGWRKVEIYIEPEDKRYDTVDIRYFSDISASYGLEQWKEWDLNKLELPKSFSEEQKGKFFIFAHEHSGRHNLRVGWMAESLLQNLSIPYAAGYNGAVYLYNPEKKVMEIPPKK